MSVDLVARRKAAQQSLASASMLIRIQALEKAIQALAVPTEAADDDWGESD